MDILPVGEDHCTQYTVHSTWPRTCTKVQFSTLPSSSFIGSFGKNCNYEFFFLLSRFIILSLLSIMTMNKKVHVCISYIISYSV